MLDALARGVVETGSIFALALAIGCGGSSKRQVDDDAGAGGAVSTGGAGGTAGTGADAGASVGGTGALGGATGGAGGATGGAGGATDGAGGATGGRGGTSAGFMSGGTSAGDDSVGDNCTIGEACRRDGEQCKQSRSEPVCCTDTLVCVAGVWEWASIECIDSPSCPAELPGEGTPCGPCAQNCSFDSCSSDGGGKNLEAHCDGSEWQVFDLNCLSCCKDDVECGEGRFCAQSACHGVDHLGDCFRDEECDTGEMCAGAHSCACGSPASCRGDTPGYCVPAGIGCCATDDDCEDEEMCVAGICKPATQGDRGDGTCWRNAECDWGFYGCFEPRICPCGMSCAEEDTPGHCTIPL
jgi:hypothetical protein